MSTSITHQRSSNARTGLFANRLVRELLLVMVVKLLVLYGLWFAFFRQPDVSPPTVEQVSAALTGTVSPPVHRPAR